MYNDFVNNPREFEKNKVLYHYPVNHDRLIIGKFCSVACGEKFLFTSANNTKKSLSTYPFPVFFEEWDWDTKMLPQHGITRETLLSEMMFGLDTADKQKSSSFHFPNQRHLARPSDKEEYGWKYITESNMSAIMQEQQHHS